MLIGRAALWGLTLGGTEGIRAVLSTLESELAFAAGLCGVTDITAIDQSLIASRPAL